MDWKLEVVVVPVTDVDRGKEFYVDTLGFRLDTDHSAGDAFRVTSSSRTPTATPSPSSRSGIPCGDHGPADRRRV
jgi:catechol 2,3-dioxygenase-like lactoylglutathione lyase family enzyme